MHLIPSAAALATLVSLAYGQEKVCNNAAALCDRSYGNITHLGAHDSFTVRNASNSYSVAADQFYTTLQQLDAGVRLVTAQVHQSSGGDAATNEGSAIGSAALAQYGKTSPQVQSGASSAGNAVATGAKSAADTVASGASSTFNDVGNSISSIFGGNHKRQSGAELQDWRLCHSNCLLYDGGSLVDWLSGIKGWLDAHPNDVVTVLLVNSDNADAGTFKSIFQASGADQYAYTPESQTKAPETWPTLNDLIGQGKRLMVFIADLPPAENTAAPYLMNEFSFIFENNYDNVQPTDFSCQPNRPSTLSNNIQGALQQNYLPFMNHFRYDKVNGQIEIPSVDNVGVTNAATGVGSLGDAAKACTAAYNRAPTFILVDFFNVASPIDIVDGLNGVQGQTSGRLIVPDTVDAATATPSPTASQTAAPTGSVSAMGDTSVTAAAVASQGASTSAASSSARVGSLFLAIGLATASCGLLPAFLGA